MTSYNLKKAFRILFKKISYLFSKMISWEDIQRQVENDQDKKRRASEAPKRSKWEEAELQADVKQKKAEEDRWGTAENARATWEYRARKILEDASCYALELKEDSRKAAYQNRSFKGNLCRYKTTVKGFWKPKEETVRVDIGSVTLGEILPSIQHRRTDYCYVLDMYGKILLVNTEIETPESLLYFEEWVSLYDILDNIFKPLIAAERIAQGNSAVHNLARRFFEESPRLRDGYAFECTYPCVRVSEPNAPREWAYTGTEDRSTYFGFERDSEGHIGVGARKYALRVPNPIDREEVKDFLMSDFEISMIRTTAHRSSQF